ncbi:MAG: carbamoyl-phosphate synthase large subunit [Actinobacteria bacterium]|nr:carbamoyl-phosphate synthase large subunit [Actinomycetota bacterium]
MPRRADIGSILIIGSGPIRIGQACEFDYSGSQACRALRDAGYRVVLANSNPATIMTDPEWADATYIEPLDVETLSEIIRLERPDALLPTLGGQTALNLAVELDETGVLAEFGVELIGADVEAIRKAEDRRLFRSLMLANGIDVLDGVIVHDVATLPPGLAPAVVRPAFTLGGTGGGLARTEDELSELVDRGIAASPIGEVLVEQSVAGWAEFELEVMCDVAGSCIVVCSIENIDPVGVHTGDSWTVAPQQTLDDVEYQRMRDTAFACVRAVGVATGGANVQFAYRHDTGEMKLIEMNPRASRSSALASKATGYPIAKLAALLAVGYTLEELPNDITQKTTAAFEPALDYVAVKAPRFDFVKMGVAEPSLGTQMQAVGESLGLGRTFPEALLKALEGLENGIDLPQFEGAHPYFVAELEAVAAAETRLAADRELVAAKRFGLPDSRIARILGIDESEVRTLRPLPTRQAVDSCAAEFEATTPYFYLSYERPGTFEADGGKTVVVVGSGPNRIGQGIEFDYACVHAARALRDQGYQVVMVNSNPETVSTDYDTSDRLYLEPLTAERLVDICRIERPMGVVVTLGGQTPLTLAGAVVDSGFSLLGVDMGAIEVCEDRESFAALLDAIGVAAPVWGRAADTQEARAVAAGIGYPVMLRPDYVLGGAGMRVATGPEEVVLDCPVLVDRYLQGAIELDVEILVDGDGAWVGGILEHVEEAGVHSGDSACVVPAPSVTPEIEERIRDIATRIGARLGVRGLLNLQMALLGDDLYVLEANPRASRTLPFLAKATGLPLIAWATRLMLGERLADLGLPDRATPTRCWAKEPVFPTDRYPGSDRRGPEMRSIGEVMAAGDTVAEAYSRALRAAGRSRLPGAVGATLQTLGRTA